MPISHFLVRPRRRAAERTNAVIDASVRELAGVSRLGIVKKNRNKSKTSPSTPYWCTGCFKLVVGMYTLGSLAKFSCA